MKHLTISLFFRLRLFHFWRFWNRKKITILTLHGIAGHNPDSTWSPLWERPTVESMATVLRQIGEYYTPITMEKATQILEGTVPPVSHGMVLTFDDGYRNNFSDALPVLEEMGIPAIFFVATGFVETGESYWVDRLDFALQQTPDEKLLLRGNGYEFDLRGLDRHELADAYRNLRQTLKRNERSDTDMLRVVDEFAGALEANNDVTIRDIIETDPHVSVATWAEQKAAVGRGASIGSHSVDHFRLDSIPRDNVDEQLIDSKRVIEEKLGSDCDCFCYPNGSLDQYVLERVKHAGYSAAVTTERGLNAKGDDLHALKRHPMPLSEDKFKNLLLISGIFELWIVKALLGTE